MRQLKYHEKKLLRKVDLLEWKGTSTAREQTATQKYCIEDRETYTRYNMIVGKIRRLALALAKLNDNEPIKQTMTRELSNKLHSVGLIPAKTLLECAKVGVGSFCKRRLSSVLADIKMVPDIKTGVTFVKGGHVKVGVETITEPSLIVTRLMEDYITWRDGSKVKETISEFAENK
ncbi:U3 small nucleolar ribonucleoprotein IMP3 [Nematocida minor]|uniref:U3 small nucleolar ribonucleoprotein IMP3 n=1 Tax=Nematocida minor TaxID=1912983 RepID=UPI0022204D69|nr:U3 small nucleolar ribonucleoprotein IMP3 [Nematocida minor]KAI5193022.1 U3 small nucleolar ribonucleoprotein IMP3 [Nematocida minor]